MKWSKLFSDIPESLDNTQAVVDKIEILNLKKDILLPAFPIPKEFQVHADANLNQWEYLQHITANSALKKDTMTLRRKYRNASISNCSRSVRWVLPDTF
jgi:DNA polymerase III alpha subunit